MNCLIDLFNHIYILIYHIYIHICFVLYYNNNKSIVYSEKVSKKRRIVIVQTDGKTKISRGALNQLKYEQEQQGDMTRTCSQCHTIDAKRWYEQRNRNYYHPRNNSNNNNDTNNEKEKCLFICK